MKRLWKNAFLAALRITGNVRRACEAAKISRQAAYSLRNADPTFAAEWDAAQRPFAEIAAIREEALDVIAKKKAASTTDADD